VAQIRSSESYIITFYSPQGLTARIPMPPLQNAPAKRLWGLQVHITGSVTAREGMHPSSVDQ